MLIIIVWSACILIIIGTELIPYLYKLRMMGKVRIYQFNDGFAVKQFCHHTYSQVYYNYDSSYSYDWYWITTDKRPTCNPIHVSQIEAEELAQSLHDDYIRYVEAHKAYLKDVKTQEEDINSAKLFKKL